MIRLKLPANMKTLRILIYARYSTEEQNQTSIDDQFAFCEDFLRDNSITDVIIEKIYDKELSGELVSRPGIDEVRQGIDNRRWDWIIAEDSSRLFRNETACGELIEEAVDNGIRVLCLHDDVDTGDEDWEDPLHEAMRHHARSNRFNAKRIKRKLLGLWRMGAAIGLLRPGYRRRPTKPATSHDPAEGPFFDDIDPKWAPFIKEAYERTSREEPLWSVAEWLTENGVPKTSNSSLPKWSDRNVAALIKRTDYRGVEEYRNTSVKKVYRTGIHKQVRSNPDSVLSRDMPHLRIVTDSLWFEANKVITTRALREKGPVGPDHPLAGIPRNSRSLLSGHFFCGACGAKMHMLGRATGGYRCGQRCWNRATAKQSLVHERISRAVAEQLLQLDGVLDGIVIQVREACADDQPLRQRLTDLRNKEAELVWACSRLTTAIESDDDPLASLVQRLRDQEANLAMLQAEGASLEAVLAAPKKLPDRAQIEAKIAELSGKLLNMDREAGVLLRRLITPIRAVPHQQLGGNLVVLRACFEMRLVELVTDQIGGITERMLDDELANRLRSIPVSVDLFDPPTGPKHFAQALKLSEAEMSLNSIGREIGISKRGAAIAVSFGKAMRDAGLTDPYVELKSPPAAASRWRIRPRMRKTG